jgi:hypothetical protein
MSDETDHALPSPPQQNEAAIFSSRLMRVEMRHIALGVPINHRK